MTVLLACVVAFFGGSASPALADVTPFVGEPIDNPANWGSIWNTVAPGGTAPLDYGPVYTQAGATGGSVAERTAARSALAALIEGDAAAGTVTGAGIGVALSPITLGVAGVAITVLVGQNMIQNWLLPPALIDPQSLNIKLYQTTGPLQFYKYGPSGGGSENVPALTVGSAGQSVWYIGPAQISGWESAWQSGCSSSHCGWSPTTAGATNMAAAAVVHAQTRASYGMSSVQIAQGIPATGFADTASTVQEFATVKVAANPGLYASGPPRHCGGSGEPSCTAGVLTSPRAVGGNANPNQADPGAFSGTAGNVRTALKGDELMREYTNFLLAQASPDPNDDAAYPDPLGPGGLGTNGHGGGATVLTPNCVGLTVAVCTGLYTAAGFTATPSTPRRTFDTADLTKPANVITTQDPPAGLVKPLTVPLTWTLNPPESDMPVTIPEPEPQETQRDYKRRLIALGLLGLFISTDELHDGDWDPHHGPNEVVRVSPRPGTKVRPGTDPGTTYDPDTAPHGATQVTIVSNDASAPDASTDADPGPGGSPFDAPAPPGISLEPLSAIASVGCSTFPFGIPCWTYSVVSSWVTAPVAPHFCMPFPYVHPDPCIPMDLWDDGMPVVRAMLLLMSFIGLAWLFMRAALGFGGGGGDDD